MSGAPEQTERALAAAGQAPAAPAPKQYFKGVVKQVRILDVFCVD